jgi:hypothetical protein
MTHYRLARAAATLLLATTLLAPAGFLATPAAAGDDDIICFEYSLPKGGSETECGTRGGFKAECKLTDPENTSDFCQDVNSENRFTPGGLSSLSGPSSTELVLPATPTKR